MPKNNEKESAEQVLKNIKDLEKSTQYERSEVVATPKDLQEEVDKKHNTQRTANTLQPSQTTDAPQPSQNERDSTLFMLNNNAPQNTIQASDREIEKYYHENIQSRSYGTIGITLGVVAVLCSIVLIIALASGLDSATTSGFLLWTFNFILLPVVGIGGSVIFALISAILGIVAITKAHKRVISWVAFALGLIILAYVVIMAGIYLFT